MKPRQHILHRYGPLRLSVARLAGAPWTGSAPSSDAYLLPIEDPTLDAAEGAAHHHTGAERVSQQLVHGGQLMTRLHLVTLRRALLKVIPVVGIVAVTVLAMRVFGPRQTAAQPAQQGDVRATSFTLVGTDGTVLAKLGPGPTGNGNLTVFDAAGRPRAQIGGSGTVSALDTDGKVRTQLFYAADGPLAGLGAMFVYDANGKVRTSAGSKLGAPFVELFDENGIEGPDPTAPCRARATLHLRADASYGLDICDGDGNLIYTAP
jgi:hypothetical protein